MAFNSEPAKTKQLCRRTVRCEKKITMRKLKILFLLVLVTSLVTTVSAAEEPNRALILTFNFYDTEPNDLNEVFYVSDSETPTTLSTSGYPIGGWAEPNSINGEYDPCNFNAIHKQWLWDVLEGPNVGAVSFSAACRRDEAYFYIIFSENGDGTPTAYVPQINRGSISLNYVQGEYKDPGGWASQDLHVLVRNGDGDWYLSSACTDDTTPSLVSEGILIDLSGLSWQPVDASAQANMNALEDDAGPGYLLPDPGVLPVEPNLAQGTGIGIYLDDVKGPNNAFFRFRSMDISGFIEPVEVDSVYENYWAERMIPAGTLDGAIFSMYDESGLIDEETPKIKPPPFTSGFRYGGWGDSTITPPGGMQPWSSVRFATWQFEPATPEPELAALEFQGNAFDAGSYFYTIFSETGTKNPTQYVTDINQGTVTITTWVYDADIYVDLPVVTPYTDLRLLLRNGEGNWYVSSIAFENMLTEPWYTSNSVDLSTLTWKAVNSTAQEDMNEMDPDSGPGVLFDPLSPDVEPNFAQCTGGGLYVDSVNEPDTDHALRVIKMFWRKEIPAGVKSQITESFREFTGPGRDYFIPIWWAYHNPDYRTDNEYTAINYNSGYRWGGHCDDIDYIGDNTSASVQYSYATDVLVFGGRAVKDGTYAYTIFSTVGNEVANTWLDELKGVTIDVQAIPAQPFDMRFIIREEDGDWLLSSVAIDNVTVGKHTVNVADLTWENVLQSAEDEMNELDPGPHYGGPGVLVGPTPDPAVPNFVNISGGGMYLDGVVEPEVGGVEIVSFTWHGLLDCGDPALRELLADYTSDCYVNMYDFATLGLGWLATYDFYDLEDLASEWLDCTEPTDVNCSPF